MARIILRIADKERGDSAGLINIMTLIIPSVNSFLAAITTQTILRDGDNISADIEDKTIMNEEIVTCNLRLVYSSLKMIPDTVVLFIISQRAQIEVHALSSPVHTINRRRRHNCQQSNKTNNAILHLRL